MADEEYLQVATLEMGRSDAYFGKDAYFGNVYQAYGLYMFD